MHWLDPLSLHEYVGTIVRFLPNAHGQTDGLLLADGREICFPPHLSVEVMEVLRVGDTVKLRGVKPRTGDVIATVLLETADGRRIIDNGPPKDRKQAPNKSLGVPMTVESRVARLLHGPKGDVRGVLLEDGTTCRLPPHAPENLAAALILGRTILLRGEGIVTEHGMVVTAAEVGTSADDLLRIAPAKPKDKHKTHKPRPDDRPRGDAEARQAI